MVIRSGWGIARPNAEVTKRRSGELDPARDRSTLRDFRGESAHPSPPPGHLAQTSASHYHVNMHSAATTNRRGAEPRSREMLQVFISRCDARALGLRRRGHRHTSSSRADRFRNSDTAGGCRIASVLLLRDRAFTLRQPIDNQLAVGEGLNKNQAAATDERGERNRRLRTMLSGARGEAAR